MLCGRTPYSGDAAFAVMLQHVTGPAPTIRNHMPECPPAIVKLLDRMLAKDPAERRATYAERIEELKRARALLGKSRGKLHPARVLAAVAIVAGVWWSGLKMKAPPTGCGKSRCGAQNGGCLLVVYAALPD
jgi:serine/threonine protein kinase